MFFKTEQLFRDMPVNTFASSLKTPTFSGTLQSGKKPFCTEFSCIAFPRTLLNNVKQVRESLSMNSLNRFVSIIDQRTNQATDLEKEENIILIDKLKAIYLYALGPDNINMNMDYLEKSLNKVG